MSTFKEFLNFAQNITSDWLVTRFIRCGLSSGLDLCHAKMLHNVAKCLMCPLRPKPKPASDDHI